MKDKVEHDRTSLVTQDQLLLENVRLRGDLLTLAIRICHDFRTPLGGIINTGELLRDILIEKDPAAAELTNALFTSADEMSKLIGQVRFVAKASAEPRPKKPVKMGTLVSGVLQRLESRILKKQATVTEPDSWPEVDGVSDWLEFIWWNFLENALRHAGERPQIRLNWQKESAGFRFQICDNGSGVSPEKRGKLFQPFNSLHEPDSTRGLGLSIVQRLAELQGGNCGHEQLPTGGSLFFFTLPAVKHADAYCLSPAILKMKSAI